MNRWLSALMGPELYWIALYILFRCLAARNVPPTSAGNTTLNWAVWLAATLGVLLSLGFFALPGSSRWWMLARLGIAGFVGLNACVIVACEAIKYPELGRDSGLMALWMLAVGVGGILWTIGVVISLIVMRGRS